MAEIVLEYYSHSSWLCTCPLPQTWEEEIELTRACALRERTQRAAPAADPPGAGPVCEDCGMRHHADDKASCIEGHGEP